MKKRTKLFYNTIGNEKKISLTCVCVCVCNVCLFQKNELLVHMLLKLRLSK